ncbi:MAG: trifunctional transcriptional regulator/proline dehydrogenase/L-glutamate gamma-semialdehyde dehydrogenase [Burkholderiales bacterium]|nr:MAG: trifunctional transcriptional regulator/proline dehydrogenase/L-glutamate gamma-semialdehyde dehydrogenase [Burkholderiales bacterium]
MADESTGAPDGRPGERSDHGPDHGPDESIAPGVESPPAPFAALLGQVHSQPRLRAAITEAYRADEAECVLALLPIVRLAPSQESAIESLARTLARRMREHRGGRDGLVQELLAEFSLSSQEGIALMCLAEALLRIPDDATRDALIRDKIGRGDWQSHLGSRASIFVHAATWGLVVTGRLVSLHDETGLSSALGRAIARSGEPLVRRAVDRAMRLLGEQFVAGRTIGEALERARPRETAGFRHSFDMLGEAALTDEDALHYHAAYEGAIDAIGAAAAGRGVLDGPGVSIKLSALHPRYARAQRERVVDELYPRLLALALRARAWDIGLNIDAEEAERLDLSLDLLERLCFEDGLSGWSGIGFVVQAYQKRCLPVVDWLVDLAQRSGRRLMVRLVKGAYWDSEIKRAQVDGLDGYPVFTRKAHTDLSYLACARRLLAAPGAVYPQFATHNAHTVAAVREMAGARFRPGQYEFQCLHGMGEPLYEHVVRSEADGGLGRPCRIYAPVGTHETLLAYLVRRLLENGANTSFVHRIADESVPVDALVESPLQVVERNALAEGAPGLPHPAIPLPRALHGASRTNSRGIDLSDERRLAQLAEALARCGQRRYLAAPIVAGRSRDTGGSCDARVAAVAGAARDVGASPGARDVRNPADTRDLVGRVVDASARDVDDALRFAQQAAGSWASKSCGLRAQALDEAAARLEGDAAEWIALVVREAGRTIPDAIAELRETVDFLRYYAAQLREVPAHALGAPLGPVVCISPWNFPLSIFGGQVAAALAAGNAVLAKPAEQTPLVAARFVRLLHEAGVDAAALQLLPGDGETVGGALVADPRVRGVVFTGSTAVARSIARALAGRLDERGEPIALIAETGGINAMIVDSSALPEQAVVDIVASAFDSAGQRCSALRVLCVQDDAADRVLAMLRGAMRELRLGRPDRLDTDVGPVIDRSARDALLGYLDEMRAGVRTAGPAGSEGRAPARERRHGWFVAPALVELPDVGALRREVFGPVLHVVRYARAALPRILESIEGIGYGLTLGVQTRLDETVDLVASRARVGNQYVNRNMIGAVVGVQPFGGEGLSGTGPKAGGPLYLRGLMRLPVDARPLRAALPKPGEASAGPNASLRSVPRERREAALRALAEFEAWLRTSREPGLLALADVCAALARDTPLELPRLLGGPTGERNTWWLAPRRAVLGVAADDADRLFQLAHALAAGSGMLWPDDDPEAAVLRAALPPALRALVRVSNDIDRGDFDAAIVHGGADEIRNWSRRLAQRDGPLVVPIACARGDRRYGSIPLERLLVERSLSVNTAAAGGNASLMTIG